MALPDLGPEPKLRPLIYDKEQSPRLANLLGEVTVWEDHVGNDCLMQWGSESADAMRRWRAMNWLKQLTKPFFNDKTISLHQAWEILEQLQIPLAPEHASNIFKAAETTIGEINKDLVIKIYQNLLYRREFLDIFNRVSGEANRLTAKELLHFLQNEQFDKEANIYTAVALISKFEPIQDAMKLGFMTKEGFSRLMTSEDLHIFKREHMAVYQNMNLPLCDYFISSSHNTYLLGHQLVGQSRVGAYENALLRGCRCLEIDCWDGPQNEPLVYHGYTLTSRIQFKDVLRTIKAYAFVASPYPVILSLENHCSPAQKTVMAHHLVKILGDMLVSASFIEKERSLPSPEQLKKKILLKDKISSDGPAEYNSEDEDSEMDAKASSSPQEKACPIISLCVSRLGRLFKKQPKQPHGINGKTSSSPKQQTCPVISEDCQKQEAKKKKHNKIRKAEDSTELSKLINLKSVPFKRFEHSRTSQRFDELCSIKETTAKALADDSALNFIKHNSVFFTRIYPKGLRAGSSNYNPSTFWNVGCQMVAMNFQTPGLHMDLQTGKFKDNGSCGYILKPEFLRMPHTIFNPNSSAINTKPLTLTLKIISANQLKPTRTSSGVATADPVIRVEIYGVPEDEVEVQTSVKLTNAYDPEWNEEATFTVNYPELALVRFCVESQKTLVGNEFIGQYTIPLLSISRGFRHVPLFTKDGIDLNPAMLFVHVDYE